MRNVEIRDFHDTHDGVRIAYHTAGPPPRGPAGKPVIVLANGLGGTYFAWRHFINHFGDEHRIVTWDYRGTYASERASLDRLSMADHVRDLEHLLDHLEIERAVFAGWSMGVAVIFEYYRQHAERVQALLPICGSPGRIFQTVRGIPFPEQVLPRVCQWIQHNPGLVQPLMRRVTRLEGLPALARCLGLVAPSMDEPLMRELVAEFGRLDVVQYYEIMQELDRHSAWDVLRRVQVPTLIVAATRDFMTPVSVAKKMKRLVRGSELFIIEGGTHYTPVEFPKELNERVERFLSERVMPGQPKPGDGASGARAGRSTGRERPARS